ncbi:MAG: hypothetical protein ABL984_14365 [Pyrinomonadaceae bacterium]
MQVVRIFCVCLLIVFAAAAASAQFQIKIPKIPKEKPKPAAQGQDQTPATQSGSAPTTSQRTAAATGGKTIYGPYHPDSTIRFDKDSIKVETVNYREYWKAKGQSNYHSWVPKLRLKTFYKSDRKIEWTADFYNPDGTLWYSEPMEWGTQDADRSWHLESSTDYSSGQAKSSVGVGMFRFKLKDAANGEVFYDGKFKVGKHQPSHYSKNQWDFYVDHDWEMPIGNVSYHFSEFNGASDSGGFEAMVSMWFKGNLDDNSLTAKIYYKGAELATANGMKESYAAGQRSTEQSIFNAANTHWQRWNFQWMKRIIVHNNGDFNMDNYPNAHYIDRNPGEYVVKVFKGATQVRETSFTVGADGRIVDAGYYKPGDLFYYRVLIPVKILDKTEKWNPTAWKTEAFYGNPMTGFPAN